MSNKMLIDASHPEETRVVVLHGDRVEEFDFESANKKPLRGNIYLAKVTRVEPSLQAAFVDYGGNRHGFLAFSEIHPDYYQIPVADRQELMEEEARASAEESEESEREVSRRHRPRTETIAQSAFIEDAVMEHEGTLPSSPSDPTFEGDGGDEPPSRSLSEIHEKSVDVALSSPTQAEEEEIDPVEILGGDAMDEVSHRRTRTRRTYKIQEVIKRRQIILVQVVKEERGNKGAALTTYLSLAGRYAVLMPNTARGGGISRKITSMQDRKMLKEIVDELEVPDGMGVILRTAGASRTRQEIRRDFEYLLRMWETVRETTLASTAPTLVYEEGSLIKRSIRDLYTKEIDEIIVAGEVAYKEAKAFMKLLMPSSARLITPYRDSAPIFAKSGVEAQLDGLFSNQVILRSGGYIVINQTEALVAIDVNSGRSTREHNIEDTALRTNIEAADEVARQLRLRDLAGLIVVDFIDMEEPRNNRAVERRMKEALRDDRARIQVGRISPFGLLEMSRQRMRSGLLEGSSAPCPHCMGAGVVRSIPSLALHVLRDIEDELLRNAQFNINVRTATHIALYILNQKRVHLQTLEQRFGVEILIFADDTLSTGVHQILERREIARGSPQKLVPPSPAYGSIEEENETLTVAPDDPATETEIETEGLETVSFSDNGERRRRRRRGRERSRNNMDRIESPQPSDDRLEPLAEMDGAFQHPVAPRGRSSARFRNRNFEEVVSAASEPVTQASETEDQGQPRSSDPRETRVDGDTVSTPETKAIDFIPEEPLNPPRPRRSGWWQRAKSTLLP